MPTYEFRCPDGHEFEKFYRTISGAESLAACPTCGLEAGRMMSPTGFAFKGSGFYLTDYGKNAHRGEAPPTAAGGEGATAPGTTDAAKADTSSGDAKPSGDTKESAPTSSDAPATSAEKKSETKTVEKKPVAAPPKASSGE